jgi:hypothetical protein
MGRGAYNYTRTILSLQIPSVGVLAATGAVSIMLSKTLGFACELERIDVVTTATASVAGSRVLNVRRGNASGTIVGTITLLLASQGTIGTVNAGIVGEGGTAVGGTVRFTDTDTITVGFAGSGTAFTGGGCELLLTFRDKNQLAA